MSNATVDPSYLHLASSHFPNVFVSAMWVFSISYKVNRQTTSLREPKQDSRLT